LEIKEWEELEECLSRVYLTDEDDTVRWALTKNGQFSVASLYKHCVFSGVIDMRIEELWHSKIPLKVNFFVWLVYQNRVQTANNLIRKKWK
jgi:S-adenosylmethionine:diacylglycerol 3-amino-3-carboxypropyl transferase